MPLRDSPGDARKNVTHRWRDKCIPGVLAGELVYSGVSALEWRNAGRVAKEPLAVPSEAVFAATIELVPAGFVSMLGTSLTYPTAEPR